jgi:hypothetical protein
MGIIGFLITVTNECLILLKNCNCRHLLVLLGAVISKTKESKDINMNCDSYSANGVILIEC